MRRPGVDRVLVMSGIGLAAAFVALTMIILNQLYNKVLGTDVVIPAVLTGRADEDPFLLAVETKPGSDPIERLGFSPTMLEFSATSFYSDQEMNSHRDRLSRDQLYRGIAPPLALRFRQRGGGVLIEWDPNPANDAIAGEVAGNPLLSTGYRIYRWRVGEEPSIIGTGPLTQISFLDTELGPRGGQVLYSVATVLQGRIGGIDTLIESETGEVLEVNREDLFKLSLIAGTTEQVTVEVSVGSGPNQYSSRFKVGIGETIGRLCAIRGVDGVSEVDFATGLTVVEIVEIDDVREETIRHPEFNPDGSRAFNETGFLFREEVRTVPIKRLEVRCTNDQGVARSFSIDRP